MSASSQHPNNNEHQEWGWKRQWGSRVARSGPGAPPRERNRVYDQPWNTLTPLQRAAAHNCLGIVNEVAWEMAMPRRLYARGESTVLTFQPVSWNGLTAQQQQDAQKHLQISKEVWNEHLALFHDDLWTVEGISLTAKESSSVLSTVGKLSRGTLSMAQLAQFLLGLGRVLTPSQAKCICEVIKSSSCWGTLYDNGGENQANSMYRFFNVHVLVASFVSDAERFFHTNNTTLLQSFWDDDNMGCSWGSTIVRVEGQPLYASELSRRYKRKMFLRLVGLSLAGAFSPSKKNDASLVLPRSVVPRIIDGWVGEEELPKPRDFAWAAVLVDSPPVSVAQILSSPNANTNTRKRGRA